MDDPIRHCHGDCHVCSADGDAILDGDNVCVSDRDRDAIAHANTVNYRHALAVTNSEPERHTLHVADADADGNWLGDFNADAVTFANPYSDSNTGANAVGNDVFLTIAVTDAEHDPVSDSLSRRHPERLGDSDGY